MSENPGSSRIYSLDVFRGATIAGMILVNNPGTWSAIYPPLEHAAWNGLTPTDLIFPFFLFIVGVSISIALGRRAKEKSKKEVYGKIGRRALLIFLLGLFLNALPYFEFSTLRIPGVLQRIAICYLFVSLIFLHTSWKQQGIIAVVLLLAYWAAMTLISVPGCAVTSVSDKACNLSAYIDRVVLGVNHIWSLGKVYDPEGILSTVPAIVTTLSGVLAGTWLKTDRAGYEKAGGMYFAGTLLLLVGWIWSFWFPLNKAMWTSSYVLYTSGLALFFLATCYWLTDLKNIRSWAKPFEVFGMNALALYIGAETAARLMDVIKVSGSGESAVGLKDWIFTSVFLPLAEPMTASLMFALVYILIWLSIMWVLYSRKIFIKV